MIFEGLWLWHLLKKDFFYVFNEFLMIVFRFTF